MSVPFLFLLSAPSGAGKTTVADALIAASPRLRRVITCTTRPPRSGEVNGRDYHFLAPEEFRLRVERGEFLEHASVYGKSYGTLKRSVLDLLESGFDVLLNIDVQGADLVRQESRRDSVLGEALVTVFLAPPSLSELERRLRGRASDAEDVIQRRLETARVEAARWSEYDYLVISGTREEDLFRMRSIYVSEGLRRERNRYQLVE
ncbi:MAG: guanylate kinase [Verrucomicrobiales bacterium]|nr:guanylate kinase [Verrucomicrobiales bacterium]